MPDSSSNNNNDSERGLWCRAYTSVRDIGLGDVPSYTIANTMPTCRICHAQITPTDITEYSEHGYGIVHKSCHKKIVDKMHTCRQCKQKINPNSYSYNGEYTDPNNPKLHYHKACVIQVSDDLMFPPKAKVKDHYGNEFIPDKKGVVKYRTKLGGKVRVVGIDTFLKLKSAGVIKRGEVIWQPESWHGTNIDWSSGDLRPHFIDSAGKRHSSPIPDPKGYSYVGCELEVERGSIFKNRLMKKSDRSRIHAVVTDGSLTDHGMEVLTTPSAGRQLIHTAEAVTKNLRMMGWEDTMACGAHAHVNFPSKDEKYIRRMIKMAYKLEPFIHERINPNRRNGRYCHDIRDRFSGYDLDNEAVEYIIYGDEETDGEWDDRKRDKYDDARYVGVNMHSIFFRGTVEFRYLEGTTDAKKLASFGLLYAGIVEYVFSDAWDWDKIRNASGDTIIQSVINTPSMKLLRKFSPTFVR